MSPSAKWQKLADVVKLGRINAEEKSTFDTISQLGHSLFEFSIKSCLNLPHYEYQSVWLVAKPKTVDGTQASICTGLSERTLYLHVYSKCPCGDSKRKRKRLLDAITGFDNTGNLQIWPGELLLAHVAMETQLYPRLFQHLHGIFHAQKIRRVCELASGMTGAAGLALAQYASDDIFQLNYVLLTDGNDQCVRSLQQTASLDTALAPRSTGNNLQHKLPHGTIIEARKLQWSVSASGVDEDTSTCVDDNIAHSFDMVCAADCIYKPYEYAGLLHLVDRLLVSPERTTPTCFLLIAPLRGGRLMQFIESAQRLHWSTTLFPPEEYIEPTFYAKLMTDLHPAEAQESLLGHAIILQRKSG